MDHNQTGRLPEIYSTPISEHAEPDPSLLRKLDRRQRARLDKMTGRNAYRSQMVWLLLRVIAGKRLGLPNNRLRFSTMESGKPFLEGDSHFHFSLSHTCGAVAVAVADRPVGVDIERVHEGKGRLADRFFTPAERAYVLSEPAGRERRFFEVWTRKEAYIKRTGAGLSVPLASFETRCGPAAHLFWTQQCAEHTLSICCEDLPSSGMHLRELAEEPLIVRAQQLCDCI